jgi:putative transposase
MPAPDSIRYDPAKHHRRSIRLPGHDYAAGGTYFVTINTAERRKRFGTLVNGRMAHNDAGRMAAACWRVIPEHFPQATLDEWIIMPDHVHGIVRIASGGRTDDDVSRQGDIHPVDGVPRVRAKDFSPLPCGTGTSRTLGSIVRGFKIGVTKSLGESPWQRNYYEIIVRDELALNAIRAYIRNNPANADVRRFGPLRFAVGNRELCKLPRTAFLASRTGSGAAPSRVNDWPIRPACVISGFLSPLERVVFDQCLADGIPMIQILARGLPASSSPQVQRAIASGRLLILSPFPPEQASFSAARAAWSNQYVLHLAHHIVIGQLSPDGMLACLLADMPDNKPITILSDRE